MRVRLDRPRHVPPQRPPSPLSLPGHVMASLAVDAEQAERILKPNDLNDSTDSSPTLRVPSVSEEEA